MLCFVFIVVPLLFLQDPQNSSRNRGYAFVEYHNTACAEYSRKKMSSPEFVLDDKAPTVSWADRKSGDSGSNSQVSLISNSIFFCFCVFFHMLWDTSDDLHLYRLNLFM